MSTLRLDYAPHKYQKAVHQACSLKSKNLYTVVAAGRQAGKSFLALYQTISWLIGDQKCLIWYVTPSEGQSRVVFKNLLDTLITHGVIKHHTSSKGNIMIELLNGSRVEFKSAGAGDNLRGPTVHYLVLDEAAYLPKDVVDTILPTMTTSGKKILIISTPRGKNHFYENWMLGKSADKNYLSFRFTSFDNPKAKADVIESFRKRFSEDFYKQEFLCEWIDSASVFSNVEELCCLSPLQEVVVGDKYFIGIDLALKNDYVVISVLNKYGNLIFQDRFNGLEAPQVEERISSVYKRFKTKNIVCEENGMGLPIIQHLKKLIPNIKGFITTEDSKSEIINQLISAFSGKELRLLDKEELKMELNAFIFTFTKTGKIRFEAMSGFHDDQVMSLAIAYDTYIKNKGNTGNSVYSHMNPPPSIEREVKTISRGLFFGREIGDMGGEQELYSNL